MAQGAAYRSVNVGTVMCNQYNVGGNSKVNSFTIRLGQVYYGHTYSGTTVSTSNRRTVTGAIWNSQPGSPYTAPDFRSTNSINVGSCYQVPMNAGGDLNSYTSVTFSFSNAVTVGGTIWIGLFTDYPSDTAIAYVRETGANLWENFGTGMETDTGYGIYFDGVSTQVPISPPGQVTNINMSPRLIESQPYTISWNQGGGDAPSGYRIYLNGFGDTYTTVGTSYVITTGRRGTRGQEFTWTVTPYNSAGDGAGNNVTGRWNQLPSRPTTLIVNNGNYYVDTYTPFCRVQCSGSVDPDSGAPYNDYIDQYRIAYVQRAPGSTSWSGETTITTVNPVTPGAALDQIVTLPGSVTPGYIVKIRVYPIDSVGGVGPYVESGELQRTFGSIRVRNDSNIWIIRDVYVRNPSNTGWILGQCNERNSLNTGWNPGNPN